MIKKLGFLLAIGLLVGCAKSDPDRPSSPIIKKATSIQSPRMNEMVTMGIELSFIVNSSGGTIDSVVVSGADFSRKFESNAFNWTPETSRTGRFNFTLTAYIDGIPEAHYPRLIILSDVEPEQLSYSVLNKYPHDVSAYTQGLFMLDGYLIESTGQNRQSEIKKVELTSGEAIKRTPIGDQYFGEGSTRYGDEIFMITWTSNVGFVFDFDLNLKRSFQLNYQGWGLTTLGDSLLMTHGVETQGSEKVFFMNPGDFSEIGSIEVYNHEGPVSELNELEMINGLLFANEWQSDNIHIIDPQTGKVLKTADLTGLLTDAEAEKADVLNGIAYDQAKDKLYVTGKNWPWLFEIKLQPENL